LAGLNQAPSNHDVTGSHKPDFQPCTHVPPGTPTTFENGCVEVSPTYDGMEIRHSNVADSPVIGFTNDQRSRWAG